MNQVQPRKMKNKEVILSPNEGTIFYYRNHPTLAARDLLGVKLNWIQRLGLKAIWRIPFIMLIWGRRNGKTFIGAIASILIAMLFPKEKVLIVAPSKRQVDWIFFNEIMPVYTESDYFKASVNGKINITNAYNRIKFYNGSTIEGFPVGTEGDKVRGAGATFLWIDEYAQMSESIINLVFKPMLLVKKKGGFNRYLITSSAFYRWNHMWSLFQYYKIKQEIDPKRYYVSNFNYHHLLLSKNLPVDFDFNIIEEAQNTMTDTEFRMEWLAEFPEEGDSFYTSQLIEFCVPRPPDRKPIEIELTGDGKSDYYLGIDVGRAEGGSNFSITTIKKVKKEGRVVNIITANGVQYQEMIAMIRRKIIDFNPMKIKLDAGGGGLTIKDLLREKWEDPVTHVSLKPIITNDDKLDGIPILEMVNITDEKHNSLYTNMKAEMEHGRLLFPMDLRRDLNKDIERAGQEIIAFKTELQVMTAKPKGKYLRFEVPDKFRSDRAMSTALAIDGYLEEIRSAYGEIDLAVGSWINL